MKSALRIYNQKAFIVGIPNRSLCLARYGTIPYPTKVLSYEHQLAEEKEEDPGKTTLC